MHFTSNRKEVTADDDMLNLVLDQNVIKCVKETKFLGVIIDNRLRACLITLHSNFEIFQKGHPAIEVMLDRRIFER